MEHGWKNMLSVPSLVGCYRKLYIFCIESRYLPTNTHNNKHDEYVFYTRCVLSLSVCSRCRLETIPKPNGYGLLLPLALLLLLIHSLLITQSVRV